MTISSGDMDPARGLYAPNPFGLYDTSGGVYEWVEDCMNKTIPPGGQNGSSVLTSQMHSRLPGKSGCDFRVFRGGFYGLNDRFVRNSHRSGQTTDNRDIGAGIRLAKDLEQSD